MEKFMKPLAVLVLAGFASYIAAWYFGVVEGNFALLLMSATVLTGVFWLTERFHFLPQRQAAAQQLEEQTNAQQAALSGQGVRPDEINIEQAKSRVLAQPWWLDWTAGLFPVIAVVFLLRSFVVEPFKIPSGSMIPTLRVGDLILVNKFTYGLRMPVFNFKITEGNAPQRGDVMVFHFPPKPSVDYIKRTIGVPGDVVAYNFQDKRLTVNGKPVPKEAREDFLDDQSMRYEKQFSETVDRVAGPLKHNILNDETRSGYVPDNLDFPMKDQCRFDAQGFVCKVPAGHYFMMGDNRDNSLDSRYWGFVPEANIVGRAFFVWMNFGNLGRIGSFQ